MQQDDDPFISAYSEAQALLQAARRDQIQEALRLLACEVPTASGTMSVFPSGSFRGGSRVRQRM